MASYVGLFNKMNERTVGKFNELTAYLLIHTLVKAMYSNLLTLI